ncbi:GAF domain-containing protein [Streptomyces scabiei]|uniref:GAF domain-containing protein n=1 Tax=Streptomyces scabiei TaxID=1930 RepID=UPI00131DC0B5|nr:GAF domain-containing protein [Streptomyces scabiei]
MNADTLKRIGLYILSGLLAGGVFVLSIVADEARGPSKWAWTATGALVAVSVVAVAAYENRRVETARQKTREQAIKAAGDLALAYNMFLVPVSEQIRELVRSYVGNNPRPSGVTATSEEDGYCTSILGSVLEAAVALTAEPDQNGLPRARSAFYAMDSAGDFIRVDKRGRTPEPNIKVAAVSMGRNHMDFILNSNTSFFADGTPGNISIINPLGTNYKAVIAVPVRADGKLFGVLTVDAPEYTDFIPAHVDLMKTLANMLAASLLFGAP